MKGIFVIAILLNSQKYFYTFRVNKKQKNSCNQTVTKYIQNAMKIA